MCIHCISGTCVQEHTSPLLGEHLRIVKKKLGPVTVHYREVSLYWGDVRQEHTNKVERQSVQDGYKTGHGVWGRMLGS